MIIPASCAVKGPIVAAHSTIREGVHSRYF